VVWEPIPEYVSRIVSYSALYGGEVMDHMQFVNENIQWIIDLIISVHDWEVDLVTAFLDLLYSIG
jgi:hypothetical protein